MFCVYAFSFPRQEPRRGVEGAAVRVLCPVLIAEYKLHPTIKSWEAAQHSSPAVGLSGTLTQTYILSALLLTAYSRP